MIKTYKPILDQSVDVFYSKSLMEQKYLDCTLYRGRGRPRKQDYSPLAVLHKKNLQIMNMMIDNQLFPKRYAR